MKRGLTVLMALGALVGLATIAVADHHPEATHDESCTPWEGDPRNPDPDADALEDGEEVTHDTDPCNPDTDGDTLPDGYEAEHATLSPNTSDAHLDHDDDGLLAWEEYCYGLEGRTPPSGIPSRSACQEHTYNAWSRAEFEGDESVYWDGTDPEDADTDDDGLCDGGGTTLCEQLSTLNHGDESGYDQGEVTHTAAVDPRSWSSDADNLPDGWELRYSLDPRDADGRDGDEGDPDDDSYAPGYADGTVKQAWTNLDEYSYNGTNSTWTNPQDANTDGDCAPDGFERYVDHDPTLDGDLVASDSDGDDLFDCDEYDERTDPLDEDTDDDRLPDGWEVDHRLNPLNATGEHGADGDPDEDSYDANTSDDDIDADWDNLAEYDEGTDPRDEDTDEGCSLDGYEVYMDNDPTDPSDDETLDTDGDGLNDCEERITRTDPYDPDTDDDGLCDGGPPAMNCLDDGGEQPHDTDPTLADTDGDRVCDGGGTEGCKVVHPDDEATGEVHNTTADPTAVDTDDDGLNDLREIQGWSVVVFDGEDRHSDPNPRVADTDGDGLTDPVELGRRLDAGAQDTDGDGLTDDQEGPDANTNPRLVDTDGDGTDDSTDPNPEEPDGADTQQAAAQDVSIVPAPRAGSTASPTASARTSGSGCPGGEEHASDWDGDGLNNHEEREVGTDRCDADTDDDLLEDKAEVRLWDSNATRADSDLDGIPDVADPTPQTESEAPSLYFLEGADAFEEGFRKGVQFGIRDVNGAEVTNVTFLDGDHPHTGCELEGETYIPGDPGDPGFFVKSETLPREDFYGTYYWFNVYFEDADQVEGCDYQVNVEDSVGNRLRFKVDVDGHCAAMVDMKQWAVGKAVGRIHPVVDIAYGVSTAGNIASLGAAVVLPVAYGLASPPTAAVMAGYEVLAYTAFAHVQDCSDGSVRENVAAETTSNDRGRRFLSYHDGANHAYQLHDEGWREAVYEQGWWISESHVIGAGMDRVRGDNPDTSINRDEIEEVIEENDPQMWNGRVRTFCGDPDDGWGEKPLKVFTYGGLVVTAEPTEEDFDVDEDGVTCEPDTRFEGNWELD